MVFNDDAIRAFGEENKNMLGDSSWHGVDEKKGRLQTYLDYQWIRRWYLNDKTTAGCNGSILDLISTNLPLTQTSDTLANGVGQGKDFHPRLD